jgi:glucose/arabinose dehydrogenase
VKQNTSNYLYFSAGDNGVSETNSPDCYNPLSLNPNNFAQDKNYKNGKIHRYNMDGTIPSDNPVSGNSMYTRGHRNPQGLVFNAAQNIMYDIEHGDRSDDEINILESGKNYGWKYVRGYHNDNNFPGEAAFISSFTIDPTITNDGLKEPMYAWCATAQPTDPLFTDWCTVAPSDGFFYTSTAIPNWNNSILVTTLKNGLSTDQEVYVFKLAADGLSLIPSMSPVPNPQRFFAEDQALNGRLRDITVSPDGTKLFLINNGGTPTDKITVYTYDPTAGIDPLSATTDIQIYPNPTSDYLYIKHTSLIKALTITDISGRELLTKEYDFGNTDLTALSNGIYYLKIYFSEGSQQIKKLVKINR